jgi:hypothetical protein
MNDLLFPVFFWSFFWPEKPKDFPPNFNENLWENGRLGDKSFKEKWPLKT